MKLFMLKDKGNGKFYKRRNRWVNDPQEASVWTSKQGAASAIAGSYPKPSEPEYIELEAEFPETVPA